MQVRDWYVESFKDLRSFPKVKDTQSEREFTSMLHHIYNRHRNVVPVMAMGVAELKQQLAEEVGHLSSAPVCSSRNGEHLSQMHTHDKHSFTGINLGA